MPEALKIKPLPSHIRYVFDLFKTIGNRRVWTEGGPSRLTWEAIQAFQNVTHSTLAPWELRAILDLDDVYVEVWFEKLT